jgi:hypothetical protein
VLEDTERRSARVRNAVATIRQAGSQFPSLGKRLFAFAQAKPIVSPEEGWALIWQTHHAAKAQRVTSTLQSGLSMMSRCGEAPGAGGDARPDPRSPEEAPIDNSSRVCLLVLPHGPIGEITGILPNGWCRVVFPVAPACVSGMSASASKSTSPRIEVKAPGRGHL